MSEEIEFQWWLGKKKVLSSPPGVFFWNSPDEMQHNAAFHQGLHCLLRLNCPLGTEIHILENFTYNPLEYTMRSPILLVSINMVANIVNNMNPVPFKSSLIWVNSVCFNGHRKSEEQ